MSVTINKQMAIDALRKRMDKSAKGEIGSFYNTVITKNIEILESLPPAQSAYTDDKIQKMQDLEQAQIEKAYRLGYENGKKDTQPEIIRCKDCKHADNKYYHCANVTWWNTDNDFCSKAERRERNDI